MKKFILAAFAALFASMTFAAELTRTTELSAENSSAVFAVPNGFSFTRAYACDAQGGSVPVSVGEPTTMNHVTLIPIALSETSQTSQISLTVVFTDNGELFTGRPAKVMRQAIKEKVANPEDVPTTQYVAPTRSRLKLAVSPLSEGGQSLDEGGQSPDEPSAQSNDGADVLILSPHDNVALWKQYATFRKTTAVGAGLTFKVVDLDTLYYVGENKNKTWNPAATDGTPRNPAEVIHKYLRENRDNLGLSYVILGGSWIDAQHLDNEGRWTTDSNEIIYLPAAADDGSITYKPMTTANAVPGIMAHPRDGNFDPSDMFYACLDLSAGQTYPWCIDDSTTHYFEGFSDKDSTKRLKHDVGVDIIVARIPLKPMVVDGRLYTEADLMEAMKAKIIRAEADDFSGTKRLGSLWGEVGSTRNIDGSLPTEYEFYDDADNMFDADRLTTKYQDAETAQRVMIKDHVAKYYPAKAVDTLSGQLWMKGYEAHGEAETAYFMLDRDYATIDSHGWAGGSESLNCANFYKAIGITLLNDVSVPCETGWMDRTQAGKDVNASLLGKTIATPCAGEAAVQGPTGGAIASLNNSRTGLTGALGSNSLSYLLCHESAKAFLEQGKDAGTTWLSAHLAFVGLTEIKDGAHAGNFEGGGAHTLEEHTLFGDPFIKSRALATKDKTFGESTFEVTGVDGFVNATSAGDLTLSGNGRIKVLQTLSVGGTSFTVEDGVEGGIGQKVVFTGEKGRVVINTTKRFYLGGVENCTEIVVNGSNVIIDCDRLTNVNKIVFEMSSGATNVLRGIVKDALAHTTIESTGGTLLLETTDAFGGTTVSLNGTIVEVGADPKAGRFVANGEPLNARWMGSGLIRYPNGTEALKSWELGSAVATESFGDIVPGLFYSGAVGSSPSGWFSSWEGEGFGDTNLVLGPQGFVHVVEDGKHPHVKLPAKRAFTLGLLADLSCVDATKDVVMLSLGSSSDSVNGQLLLMSDHGKIKLVITGTNGGSAAKKYENLFTVTSGYHLYTIERIAGSTNSLKLWIDGVEKVNDTYEFSLGTGLQIGSQFGGLKLGREKAIGMAVSALVGYDAVLDDKARAELHAMCPWDSPMPVLETADVTVAGATVTAASGVFAQGKYISASKGTITYPAGTELSAEGLKLLNQNDDTCSVVNNIYGTLTLTGTSSAYGPYYDYVNDRNPAGVMMGHWKGASTINVYTGGRLIMENGTFLINYDATSEQILNIEGGLVRVKDLTNFCCDQNGNQRNKTGNYGKIKITSGGVLEVGAWTTKPTGSIGTLPITINGGTIKATADWTCPWNLTLEDAATFDANGHDIVFSGNIGGTGSVRVIDSVGGGSVTILGSFNRTNTPITVASSVSEFGCAGGAEGRYTFEGTPSRIVVRLTDAQLQSGYTAFDLSAQMSAGATVVFTDLNGYVYQETAETITFAAWLPKPYYYDGITWSYVYLPYERDGTDSRWEPLINWRQIWTNGTKDNSVQLFTSGNAPLMSNSNLWDPAILNGAEFENDGRSGEIHNVFVDQLEGWNMKLGVYNGVHLTVGKQVKFQKGSDGDHYLRVGENSRITFNSFGGGNNDGELPIHIAAKDGIVFKTDVPNKTYEYYFTNGGTVKFESGLASGTHKVKEIHATLGNSTGSYYDLKGVQVANFNNKGSSARFTSENGALKLSGFAGVTRYKANTLEVLRDAKDNGLGGFTLMQGDAGVYAMYAEKSDAAPTEITVNGPQTGLDLTSLPYDTITKVKITGAWGYFKGDDHRISTQVEFNDTAAGLPAFRWENGYGSKYVAFENATGHGTIFINGGTKTSQAMFFKGGDFDGSIILTNGNNRVFFGTPTEVQQASASRIEVKSGATANLKDGGIWAASELAINDTLNCKGAADIICFAGIAGVENIHPATGYEKSVMKFGDNVARVWVRREGELPQAEGPLNFKSDAVTIPSFDMGANLLKVTSGTVTLSEDAVVVAPHLEVMSGASFVAAARIGDTYFGSFAKAVQTAVEDDVIELLADASYVMSIGQVLRVRLNGHTLTYEESDKQYTVDTEGDITEIRCSTQVYTITYHIKYPVFGFETVALEPESFVLEELPLELPQPTEENVVFHGWYWSEDFSGDPIDMMPVNFPRVELNLYGYFNTAVATVNGKPFDNWSDAFAEQERTHYEIQIVGAPQLPDGYMSVQGRLAKIVATLDNGVAQTDYSSLAEALAAARETENAVIVLKANASGPISLNADETLRVKHNGFTLSVVNANPESHNLFSSLDEATGIKTYSSAIKTFTITIPELDEGVSIASVSGATNVDGIYTAEYGSNVTITYAIAENYIVSGSTSVSFENVTENKTATAPTATLAAAKIGPTLYPTIADALAHASDGDIVWISGDIPETHKKTVDGKIVAKVYYDVTTGSHPNSRIEGLPTRVREDQNTITFTVTPQTGFHLTSVKANGVELGVSGSYSLTVNADTTIMVVTAINTYRVIIPSVANTTYTVTINGVKADASSGSIIVNHGDRVVVTYSPVESHEMTPVEKDLGAITANTNVSADDVNPTIKAFAIEIAQVANATYTIDGNASSTSSITVDWGSSHMVVYTAAEGYEFTDGTAIKEIPLNDIRDNATVGSGLETSIKRYTVSIEGLEAGVSATINGATGSSLVVGHGTSVTIKYSVEGAYVLSKTSEETFTATSKRVFTAPTKTAAVAKVGSIYYATLKGAVDSGTAEIEVIANVGEETVELTKNLTLNVQTDCTFSAILTGAHSLTKAGAGKLTINAAQTLTGDFIVAEGKVEASAAVREKNANAYVEVRSGANLTFTTGVQVDSGYKFKLAGSGLSDEGALVMSAAGNWMNNMQITSIELTDDATVGLTIPANSGGTGFIASQHGASSLILNGHTFTKKGVQPFFFCNTTVSDSQNTGKIVVAEGAIELVYTASAIQVPVEGRLDIQAPLTHTVNSGKSTEYEAAVNAKLTKAGAGTLTLKNTSTLGSNAKFAMNNNSSGTLKMTDNFSVACGGAIVIETGKTLNLDVGSWLKVVGGLKGAGTLNLSGSATVSLNSDDAGIVVDGTTINTSGNLSLRGIGNRTNDSGTDGDCILKNATINITGGTVGRRGVVKIDGDTSITKTGGTVGDTSGGTRFEFDAAELLDGATLKVSGLDSFNVTTHVPYKHVVGNGTEASPYSLAITTYTVTLGEHAHAAVSDLPASVREDAAPISFTVTPDDDFEVTVVKANETVLTAVDGVYSHKVTSDTTITVETARIITNEMTVSELNTKGMFYINADATLTVDAEITGNPSIVNEGSSAVTVTLKPSGDKRYVSAADVHRLQLGANVSLAYDWQPGKVISVNFDSGRGEMSGETIDMTFAGKVPRSSWVNTSGGSGTNIAVGRLWDSDAEAIQTINGMTIGYSSLGTYGPKVTATLPFMKGYLDLANYANQSVTIDLAGIPFKKCDLIVYFQTDNSNGFRPVTITHNYGATTETFGYDSDKTIVKSGYSDPWGGGNQADISYQQNVMRIDGLVGSVLHIVTLPSATYRTSVAAIQIVENTEGIVTYRRNPAAASNDWMVENGWLLPNGTPVTWSNPDLASGQIYTAEIDADHVSDIKLTSQVSASSVIVTSTTEKEFKFLTDEDLGHVATPDANPKSILNAPVDATGFKGALYLQSRISGAISMGTQMHITFVAMDEGVETTAYPYEFVGNLSTITKVGPGIFRVPQSMAGAPYNIEEGYILYDYEGDDTVQLGKVTGDGTAILKTANLQLAADNTANLDWQSDYLKVNGNLFASGSMKTLNISADKTVEVIDTTDQANARDNVYKGSGTLVFGGNGSGYHLLNANSLPATSLTMQLENSKGLIIPGDGITLSNISGSKGFRSDYDSTKLSRPVKFVQSKNTVWSGNFVCGNNPDRIGTVTVSGANGATEKTLTLAGDYSSVDNALVIDASGAVKLTGTWKGSVTVNGEFGGTGTIKNSTITFVAGSTLNAAWGPITLGESTSFATGSTTVVGASVGDTLFTLADGVEITTLPTLTNTGYALKQEGTAIKFVIAEGYAPVYAADGTTIESARGPGKIYVSSDALSQAWGNEVTFETAEGKRTTFIKGNTPETTDTVVVLKTTQFLVKDDKAGTTLEIGDSDHAVIVAFAQSSDSDASYTVNGLHLKIAAGSQVDIDNQSRASDSNWKKDITPFVYNSMIEGEGTLSIPLTMTATLSGTTSVTTAIKLEGTLIVNSTASIDETKLYTSEGTRKYIKKTVNVDSVEYSIVQVRQASKSLNLDGGYSSPSAIIGGTALVRTGDDFGSYVAVRKSTTNKGAVPSTSAGKNGIYCNNALFSNADTWSVLTVAKLDATNNGVLWSCGKYNDSSSYNGLALIESSGNTVKLVKWARDANPKHTEILSYTVDDATLKCQLHSYIVTCQSTADGSTAHKFTLYVDGVQKATSDSDVTFSVAGYQLCSVHGNVTGAGCSIGTGIILDEFGLWDGAALSSQEAAAVAAYYPISDEAYADDRGISLGTKVIGLADGDVCEWVTPADNKVITSHVGAKYDQVVVTMMIDLPKTATATKIVSVNESSTAGASGNKADLWWNGSVLYLGHSGAYPYSDSEVAVEQGLHLISMTVVNGNTETGTTFVVDGDHAKKGASSNLRWSSDYPTGTFTYQGDIKSITLDFTSSNGVSGFDALPKFTQKGAAVTDLATISEILEMTGKSIGDKTLSGETVAADVTMGSFVETGSADTIGITVGTSLDLPNGEVTILVEDPDHKGKFVDLREIDPEVGTLVAPTSNIHDARNQLVVPISSLLNGAKSRLFRLKVSPK